MDSLNMDTMVHFVIKCALTKNILYITIKKKKKKDDINKRFCTNLVETCFCLKFNTCTMEDPLSKDLTHTEK